MKILHFAPDSHLIGAAQLAEDLPYALQMYDVQNMLLTPAEAQVMTGSKLRHFRYHPYPLLGMAGKVLKLSQFINQHRPLVLQAYGYEGIAIAARACKRVAPHMRPRLVGALTGYPPPTHPAELGACDALTALSDTLRQAVEPLLPKGKDIQHIPYGVNETLCYSGYAPSREKVAQWREQHPELTGRFVLCLPGPISAHHGTLHLIPVMAALRQQEIPVHTLIAGDTNAADESYLATLRRRLRAAELDSAVTWVGAAPELRDVLCMSHAVLSFCTAPAAYDRPILEALALGKHVVGFNHGAVGEYLHLMNPLGALPVGDHDAVADVLSQWHDTPPDPLGELAAPYRLSDTAENYYTLYNSLI